MMATEDQLRKLADELIGTSGVYDEAFSKEYGVNPDELDVLLMELAFRCEKCGWWASVDDQNDLDEIDETWCSECCNETQTDEDNQP